MEQEFLDAIYLKIFWAAAFAIAFNMGYFLFILDVGKRQVSKAKIAIIAIVGTLIVIATYADILSWKKFQLRDCFLLAFAIANGWMAENLFEKVLEKARNLSSKQPIQPTP